MLPDSGFGKGGRRVVWSVINSEGGDSKHRSIDVVMFLHLAILRDAPRAEFGQARLH